MRHDGDNKAGAKADRIAGKNAAYERLNEILAQHRQGGDKARRHRGRRRHQHGGHAEAAYRHFPKVEHERPEQQRDGQVSDAAQRIALRLQGGEARHHKGCRQPCSEGQQPKSGTGGPRDLRIAKQRERDRAQDRDPGKAKRDRRQRPIGRDRQQRRCQHGGRHDGP